MNEENLPESGGMELIEHLRELRAAIIRSAIAIIVGALVAWNFRNELAELFTLPIREYAHTHQIELVAFKLTDVLTIHLQIAFWSGLLIAFPYVMFEFWKFVSPGLYENERKVIGLISIFGMVFFLAGSLFSYVYVVPAAVEFLAKYSEASSFGAKLWLSLPRHVSFVMSLIIAFGIISEVPLFMVALSAFGIIDPKVYAKNRGIALIILAILSAVLTPPDPLSMILMLVPMYGLYELAVWISFLFAKRSNHARR